MRAHQQSDLTIIQDLLKDISASFDNFTIDRIWNEDKTRLTVCFTAQKMKVPKGFGYGTR